MKEMGSKYLVLPKFELGILWLIFRVLVCWMFSRGVPAVVLEQHMLCSNIIKWNARLIAFTWNRMFRFLIFFFFFFNVLKILIEGMNLWCSCSEFGAEFVAWFWLILWALGLVFLFESLLFSFLFSWVNRITESDHQSQTQRKNPTGETRRRRARHSSSGPADRRWAGPTIQQL